MKLRVRAGLTTGCGLARRRLLSPANLGLQDAGRMFAVVVRRLVRQPEGSPVLG